MFSLDLDNDLINPYEISNGRSKIINLTYKPSAAGKHEYKFVFSYEFFDENGKNISSFVQLVPIIQDCGLSRDLASAVEPTITISESSLEFGNVIKGKTRSKSFTVNGRLASDLTLSLPWASNYKVSTNTITPEEAAKGATVTVTYIPSAVGIHNEKLYIDGGGVENVPPIDLSGKCVMNQTITVTPSTWDFGTVNKGEEPTKEFLIEGINLNDQISVISTWDEGFEVSNDPLPASGGIVTVTFKPTSAGDYSFTFYVGNSEVESIPITVTGKCVEPPKGMFYKLKCQLSLSYLHNSRKSRTFVV